MLCAALPMHSGHICICWSTRSLQVRQLFGLVLAQVELDIFTEPDHHALLSRQPCAMRPILLCACTSYTISLAESEVVILCSTPCLPAGKATVFYTVRIALATISAYAETQLVR